VFTPLRHQENRPHPVFRQARFSLRLLFKIKSKVSPSAGWKRPSRDGRGREVTIFMNHSKAPMSRLARGLIGWLFRIAQPAKVLAGILALPLLFNTALAATPAVSAGESVTLTWGASPDTSVIGYNIYYGSTSGVYTNEINVGNVTSATVFDLVAGVTYYFAATAYYADGTESVFSNEISRTVPATIPALQIRCAVDGQFTLTINGLAGHTYQILATADLVTWNVIGTVTVATSGSLEFTDTNAASHPTQFYRTQEVP
jgi:hypothetical protein